MQQQIQVKTKWMLSVRYRRASICYLESLIQSGTQMIQKA